MKTTTRVPTIKDIDLDSLTALSGEWNDPAWVLPIRKKALENYLALPWPDKKDNRWKRTNLGSLGLEKQEVAGAALKAMPSAESLTSDFKDYLPEPASNGTPASYYADLSKGFFTGMPLDLKERGVEWLTFREALDKKQEKIQKAWESAIEQAKSNKFLSLTLAVASTGSYLEIPKGQVIKTPLSSFISLGNSKQAQFAFNFVFLEEAAEAHVWEDLIGSDSKTEGTRFISTYTSVNLKENARVSCYYLQHWDGQTVHFQFQDVQQGAFSRFNGVAVSMGSQTFHNETTIALAGQGAENKVLGVLFGEKKQNFENWITQNHIAPKTISDIQYRGALKGAAQSFFSGMVSIEKPAQRSDAYQSAKTLLLSTEARADAIPNLEILADDVKCSHGAAVGPVDEDQKYYLQTRGVRPDDAEEIIIQGFFEPVISEVPSPIVQDRLRSFVEQKLK